MAAKLVSDPCLVLLIIYVNNTLLFTQHYVTERVMHAVWNEVIKEQFPSLQKYINVDTRPRYAKEPRHQTQHAQPSVGSGSKCHSVTSSVSICSTIATTHTQKIPVGLAELSIIRALQAANKVPYLTRWYY